MTIKTNCEVCGKTIRYTDVENQVSHVINNPEEFCKGHIAEPTGGTIKTIMKILRTTGKNPNNRFFISKKDGSYIGSAYLNTKDGSYFPSIPKGSYEVSAGTKSATSYLRLEICIHRQWVEIAREEMKLSTEIKSICKV